MKKILLIALVCIFISCSQGNHPDYAANVETVKTQLALQGSEADLQAQLDLAHDDIQWQPAFYGSSPIGKEEYGTYLKGWQDAMEDVVYTPTNFLPGVSPETGLPDGSVRISMTIGYDKADWPMIRNVFFDMTTVAPLENDVPQWTGNAPANNTIIPTSQKNIKVKDTFSRALEGRYCKDPSQPDIIVMN